ncbi:PEP-CTERM sorting domain-containing protein [uncultured Paraglaciecola sp.]|uniref:PEP-CTERM sorting domain-containing protein n=1 Tax=uncultured Paraglaciecola sp. TaxID=1765024 RepID=UPI0030D898FF|tara:strand:- start:16719 stop:17378 length:660 start_codon:yes stop_codon:yes gene_type:complete
MKKLLLLGFLSMFGASQAHASFTSIITGADMAGLQVTANFTGGLTETLTWQVISTGTGLTDTVSLEGEEGGVNGSMFSLTQKGDSIGNVDNNGTETFLDDDVFFGLWSLTNKSQIMLTSIVISALGTDVVFDSEFDDNGNGSGLGRAFIIKPSGVTALATYSDLIQEELYSTLSIALDLDSQGSINFFADTDIKNVPAPATLSLLLLALGGLVVRRKQA